jgi:predicted nucleic acid-binding protein
VALVDASAYFAVANAADAHHGAARRVLERLSAERWRLVTTNFLVAETHALMIRRLNHEAARAWLRDLLESDTRIVRVTPADERRAVDILFRQVDKDYSLTDAISFVVMERLGITVAFAFDRHFAQYGFGLL